MEEERKEMAFPGSRQLNLKKSFKLGIRSLLTACSKEEFFKAFPNFSPADQERLYRLFIQVITSLHENIEGEFESLCLETQVGAALDTVEQFVEEQSLDLLLADKTSVADVMHSLSVAKRSEIEHLKVMLEEAEEQKHLTKERLEIVKKERQEFSGAADSIEKLKSGILSYEKYSSIFHGL